VTAPIVLDRPKAFRREKEELFVPRVGIERPPMTEDDGLA
jgi:hypothetical protein